MLHIIKSILSGDSKALLISSRTTIRRLLPLGAAAVLLAGLLSGCGSPRSVSGDGETGGQQPMAESLEAPETPREFRAVWVATVANIDWPSEPGLPVEEQKRELIQILDRAASMNMNAVVFQVRPAADALYDSRHEPWSAYLSGQMGEAPVPYYDPLEFVVEEAHKRGLELHAWFNPYRARHPSDTSKIASNHISQERPDLVHQFGEYQWMDPGLEEVRQISRDVIRDVVERYDVDGVHLDDYFYPYPSYGGGEEFPDSLSWQQASAEQPDLSRDDWRRSNVDRFIREVYEDIQQVKPHVKFGISPFGTWRPGYPAGTGGFDAYSQLYADARLWLREGWVDYFTPQIYNRIDRVIRPFPVILQWWAEQNTHDRHIWPGLYTSRSAGSSGWPTEEITGQIYIARGHPGVTGSVHFSMQSLLPEWNNLVRDMTAAPYARPALIPDSPWIDEEPPERPSASVSLYRDQLMIEIDEPQEDIRWWSVWSKTGGRWELDIIPGSQHSVTFAGSEATVWPEAVAIAAVDRNGNESDRRLLSVPERPQERLASRGEQGPERPEAKEKGAQISEQAPAHASGQQESGGGEEPRQAEVKRQQNVPAPEMVERAEWGPAPGGIQANGVRRNLAPGDRLQFRDMSLELHEMIPGVDGAMIDRLSMIDSLQTFSAYRSEIQAGGDSLTFGSDSLGRLSNGNPGRIHADSLRLDSLTRADRLTLMASLTDSLTRADSLLIGRWPGIVAGNLPDRDRWVTTPDTARLTLYRYGVAEEIKVPEGEAINWHGYHIGALAVNMDGQGLAGGLAEMEVATVSSLSLTRAASVETGDASQRLRVPHNIHTITLHHSGSPQPLTADEDPVERLQNLYNWGRESRNWWDVPYHYLIGLDGTIYEGRDSRYAGDTNTTYDTRGHLLVTVMGNYDQQEPTEAQIEAISELMAWTADRHGLTEEDISAHYEQANTGCPGVHLREVYEQGVFHEALRNR